MTTQLENPLPPKASFVLDTLHAHMITETFANNHVHIKKYINSHIQTLTWALNAFLSMGVNT
jgi:hypothetical protein